MRVLLDTDVVIDFLMAREPFAQRARQIFELNAQRKIQCYIASITPLNVFYVARKSHSLEETKNYSPTPPPSGGDRDQS